jgi:hypothetical protein
MWHFVEIILLAFLASCLRTLSAYHCEPNAIILIKIGIASSHFAVKYNYISASLIMSTNFKERSLKTTYTFGDYLMVVVGEYA